MRLNYSDEESFPGLFDLWQANIDRCLKGKKGQAALLEFREALLALPEKRLIADALYDEEGSVCAVGAYGAYKGVNLNDCDPDYETDEAGFKFGLPRLVAWKLVELNDIEFDQCSPEERYTRMLNWVEGRIIKA